MQVLEEHTGERAFRGIGVAPGIAIGPAYIYSRDRLHVEQERIPPEEVDAEIERFEHALALSERTLRKIISVAREKLGAGSSDIFEAQVLMLRDEALRGEVSSIIRRDQVKADYAVRTVLDRHRRRMEASDNEYLRERSNDFLDVEERVIRHLRREKMLSAVTPDTIVVAESLTAADVVLFSRRGIRGCVIDYGGATSHVAIMARSLGLPAVVGSHGVSDEATAGDTIVLDGFRGDVILSPSPDTVARHRLRQKRYQRLIQEQKQIVDLPPETLDGHRIVLRANLEFESELDLLEENGAEGIGLFRTEVLFLMEGRLDITEDEQFAIYRAIGERVGVESATIRLLDLGGDKMLPMAHREHNPFLGWRGVRILLDKRFILEGQLRATLRASAYGPLRILVPMVTTVKEIRLVKEILEEQKEDLRRAGIPFDEEIQFGVMIEVPSAALLADRFALEVDFMSIGTNDLTQYVLAVDRGNDLVAPLYQELHPAVLRLIKNTADAAHRKGISVSVCGEMAADTRNVPILVGLGVDELSASPVYIPQIKRVIRALQWEEVRRLADRALEASDGEEVAQMLDSWLVDHPFDVLHFLEEDEVST